jgi:hypothetical protein
MRDGLSNSHYRMWVQTTGSCFGTMAEVVSVSVKGRTRSCQVRVEETSASEPLMTCGKRRDDVKTRGVSLIWDKFGGYLSTAQSASGTKAA